MDLTEHKQSSELLVDGVLLKAYRDSVLLPNGNESIREWIDHPGASAVVPLFKDGSTLLIRQFRYGPGREFLEVPAGKLDVAGESPEVVANRELEEEVGFRAEKLTRLGETYPCIGYGNEVIHIFLAEELEQRQSHTEDDEFVIPVRMSFQEAVELARNGEIQDSKSAVALMLAGVFVEKR